METKILKIYKWWLYIGLTIWNVYFFANGNALPLYADLLILIMYILNRAWKANKFPRWWYTHRGYLPYFLIALGMVLLEETLAGLINNINEGFAIPLFLTRVGQFWAFNLLAFAGLIFALAFIHKLRLLTKKESVLLVSLFGIYAEHVYMFIVSNFLIFLVYAPLVIFIYYLIFAPSLYFLSGEEIHTRSWPQIIRYVVAVVLVFCMSLPFIGALSKLRATHPDNFPPCSMIAC